MKKYKYSRKKIEKELVDWKENSGSTKRFNGILMRLLSTLPQEEKKEWIRCEKCGEHINFKMMSSPSPPEFEEIGKIGDIVDEVAIAVNTLVYNQNLIIQTLNKLIKK